MRTDRRRALLACTVAALTASASAMAQQDAYPSRPVTLVVPFAAGGSADILARVIGAPLSQVLRQPVVVEVKAGAGGTVGTSAVAQAAADGHTLLLNTVSLYAINPALYGRKAQEAIDHLTPVAHLAEAPLVFAVAGDSPVNDFPGLLAQARASATPLSYATPGIGTDHHLLGELIARAAGIRLNHVPYRGAAAAMGDVAGRQVDLLITLTSTAQPMTASGRLKLIAAATSQPLASHPQLSVAGQTLKGAEMLVSYGIMAPAGTPASVIGKLNEAINTVLKSKPVSDRLVELGLSPTGGTVQSFARRMEQERLQREAIIRDAGVKLAESK